MKLRIDAIRLDGGTQPRERIDRAAVDEYAKDMLAGAVFPPVVVFHDGEAYWLADGYHRLSAARRAKLEEIEAEILMGTRRDALLHACGANASHGLRRSSEDKERVVTALLRDSEWSRWSDSEIARRCKVSRPLVSRVRSGLTCRTASDRRTYTTRHGTTASMHTGGIGHGRREEASTARPRPEPAREADPEPEPEPAVETDPVGEDAHVRAIRLYIEVVLEQAMHEGGSSARHMVINETLKYVKRLSAEMYEKAAAV